MSICTCEAQILVFFFWCALDSSEMSGTVCSASEVYIYHMGSLWVLLYTMAIIRASFVGVGCDVVVEVEKQG
jgi:hypothetical protein